MGGVEAAGTHVAEHEVGQCAARIGAVENERAARVARLFKSHGTPGDVGSHTEEVLAHLPRQAVVELQ